MYLLKLMLALLSILSKFTVSSVVTEAPPDVQVPLFITPLKFLPQPFQKTARFYSNKSRVSFFSKVTVWDVWKNTDEDVRSLLNSSVFDIIKMADKLYRDGVLRQFDELYVYDCRKYCYNISLDDISSITHYNKSYLSGATLPTIITLGELHNAVVKTMETIFCFTMTHIEESLGQSSTNVTETEWGSFVSEIAWYAIKCRADILVVTPSELAELVRRNESELLEYDLEMLKKEFIFSYENVLKERRVFEHKKMNEILAIYDWQESGEGSGDRGHWSSLPMYHFVSLVTNFTIRDLEILYNWHPSQLYALEFIPIQSYNSCQGLSPNRTMFNIVQLILAVKPQQISTCPVSMVLSRSIDLVRNFSPRLVNVFNESVLGIFTKATGIWSWKKIADTLQLNHDVGIYVDAPRIADIMTYKNLNEKYIKSLSVPQIIKKYLSEQGMQILVKDYQWIFNKLLSTYDFTLRELLDATRLSNAQLESENIPSVHRLLLDIIFTRYEFNNFAYYPDYFDGNLNTTATLPTSEWPKIVNAVIQSSFNQTADAFFADLLRAPQSIKILSQPDGFKSISITNQLNYFDRNVSRVSSCLFNRKLTSIYSMPFKEYHTFYNYTMVDKMKGKIVFETKSLQSILAQRGLFLGDIENETLLDTINFIGLYEHDIECLYGRSTLSVLTNGITWRTVQETRLCQPFLDSSLLNITLKIENAPIVQCADISGCHVTCNANAQCIQKGSNFVCSCVMGYSGNGSTCTDINECKEFYRCDADAICTNTLGSFSCICMTGYSGDGFSTCYDIDECISGNPCHENAKCNNTAGSYTCTCKGGFVGDGIKQCQDISGCDVTCNANAQCIQEGSNFVCSCVMGYSGDGSTCTDVNECKDIYACDADAICTNSLGSFSCLCTTGYSGDGFSTCYDIDECISGNQCHEMAKCNNTAGSYTCTCEGGFVGDGIQCQDVNECLTGGNNDCHVDANCINEPGNFRCVCKNGQTGDGKTCTDIDECISGNQCHEKAKCNNTAGSYTCTCKDGFVGDGIKQCQDVNECLTGGNNDCHADANCINEPGNFRCVCKNGQTGDGKKCTATANNNSESSSDNGPVVIIGSAVGGTVVLLVIILLVGFCFYKRNQSRRNNNESQQRKQHRHFNVENAAYVSDFPPKRQQTPHADDSYETIEDYTQLDHSRRVAEADNQYEHLRPQDSDYTQLSELRDQTDGQYASLNVGSERERDASSTTRDASSTTRDASSTTTADVNASCPGNQNSDEPIYIELP